ncbi:MAG: nucleotidyl transferase AbiEii/AbiGii toxin family protein [Desulfitobacteriaceae bacterium]|nr:nucleotidyl transferase AbiEii/AbiGii toxin family protein [Desulfitobacteriaceae bacterium]MDI6915929.1 nucleotidyl transferase AbiEii/AbiGii toxin family protein [Desulfitobacteriaceae bacterium]
MTDIAQSVLDKLKIKARASGKGFQLILQLFCQEEFLRRLQHSSYSHNLILKGGLFLYYISGFQGRPTQDIDFLIKNLSNTDESIYKVLDNIICTDNNSVVNFEVLRLEPIAEHRVYNGVRAKLIARVKNTRTPFDIDMGIGDVIIPKPELKLIPTQLPGFESPSIFVYSLESTIAEKLDAIISRLELTSRMKDFYDIYYLAGTYSFDSQKLKEAVFETLQHRGTLYDSATLDDIRKFPEDRNMLNKWQHFTKNVLKLTIEFQDVVDVLVKFIGPVYESIVRETEFFGEWNPELSTYEPYRFPRRWIK